MLVWALALKSRTSLSPGDVVSVVCNPGTAVKLWSPVVNTSSVTDANAD